MRLVLLLAVLLTSSCAHTCHRTGTCHLYQQPSSETHSLVSGEAGART